MVSWLNSTCANLTSLIQLVDIFMMNKFCVFHNAHKIKNHKILCVTCISTPCVYCTYYCNYSPRLRDKIWEWPGDEATYTVLLQIVKTIKFCGASFSVFCRYYPRKKNCHNWYMFFVTDNPGTQVKLNMMMYICVDLKNSRRGCLLPAAEIQVCRCHKWFRSRIACTGTSRSGGCTVWLPRYQQRHSHRTCS